MDAPTVRTGGWWVLLSVFCGLPACTPPPKRAAIPTPVWFEPTPEPVIEFPQLDWQTLDFADFPVYQPLETPARLPDPAGIDDSEWKLIDTIEHWLDPEPEPNFAGRFLAITHGCGSGCHEINVIDLSTGVWRKDLDLPYYYGMSPESRAYPFGHTVHRHSRLLVIAHLGDRGEGYYYYEYTNDRLELIRFEEWDTSWNRGESLTNEEWLEAEEAALKKG